VTAAFVGIVSPAPSEQCGELLWQMAASCGVPDPAASYCLPGGGMYLAWTGQADQSRRVHWQMADAGALALLLAGDVARAVGGVQTEGQSRSAQVALGVLNAYRRDGPQAIARLENGYAGALVDARSETLLLFNDRFGIERVFVHRAGEKLFFASEAKALLAIPTATREFDERGLAEFLACGCTIGTRSLYKDIEVLPAASAWTLGVRSGVRRSTYFSTAAWESQEPLEPADFINEFQDKAPAIIRRYGEGGDVGLSLTGGLDSRMVLASLPPASGVWPCYTFGSMYRETFDVRVGREVARRCSQPHTVIPLDQDFLREVESYLERAVYYADGYIGLSGAAELYLNSRAHGIAPIRLTGNYGSELLRGVRAFKAAAPTSRLLQPPFRAVVDGVVREFSEQRSHPVTFTVLLQASHQGFGRRRVEQSQVALRDPFLDYEMVRLIYRSPRNIATGHEASLALIRRRRPDLLEIPTDRGELGGGSAVVRTLRRTTRELLFKGEYWASHGMPHWLAASIRHVPWLSPEAMLQGRHKFQHFRRWSRNELAGLIRDIVTSAGEALSSHMEPDGVRWVVDEHLQGRRNFLDEVDKLLTLAIVSRTLLRPHQPRIRPQTAWIEAK
jgi:asparagine synthase (glutamine-hydrolysing)